MDDSDDERVNDDTTSEEGRAAAKAYKQSADGSAA